MYGSGSNLPPGEDRQLCQLLYDYHDVFSLEEGEQGETSLVEFEIDTGQSMLKKQPARRVPYSAHQEIADQLQKMQNNGVIQESQSPVVLVRKTMQ